MSAEPMKAAQTEPLWRVASTRMPTKWGMFDAIGYERGVLNGTRRVESALVMVMGDPTEGVPLLRIHSQCFTGEVLGSLRCDCHDQLELAMRAIAEEGRGLVIYEYQEGRGIGLMSKLAAYELQDAGLDTVEANHALGLKADCRDFNLPAAILRDLYIGRVRLLSNNPRKAEALAENGIEVVVQFPCEAAANPHSAVYLRTKKEKMGHTVSLGTAKAQAKQKICVRCDLVGWRNTCPVCAETIKIPVSDTLRRSSIIESRLADISTPVRHVRSRPQCGIDTQPVKREQSD